MIETELYKFNSLLIALLICLNPLAWVLNFVPGGMVTLCAIIWILFIGHCFMFYKSLFNISTIVLTFVILTFYIRDFMVQSNNDILVKYFDGFIALGILGLRLGSLPFSLACVLKYICVISLFLLPYIGSLNDVSFLSETGGTDYGAWMGISYGLVRFICAIMAYMIFFPKKNTHKYILLAILLFYLLFFFRYASRGAIVAVFLMYIMTFSYTHLTLPPILRV